MHKVLEQLGLEGIIPVAIIEDEGDAEPLAAALLEGGLSSIEVTFRTQAARNAIARIAKASPRMLLGAGTVLTIDQVKTAVDLGCKFIVSPGLNQKVVEYCLAQAIPVTPGVLTPTEIGAALELGLDVLKFFPAEASGGLEYLKAISAPYRSVKFIPTGGIDEASMLPYLKHPQVLACGGSWMVKADMITGKRFDEIKTLAAQAVQVMLGFELRHVGINNTNAEEAMQAASRLSAMLRLPLRDGASSTFVGMQFEFLKRTYLGRNGHIALGTNFIHRAIAYLAKQGIAMRDDTRVEKNGKLSTVYLDLELGGFAFHLIQV